MSTNKKSYIALFTFLFAVVCGVVSFFLPEGLSMLILPAVVVPFLALLCRGYLCEKKSFMKSVFVILAFATVLIALNLLGIYIYELENYGKGMLYFILWKDCVCISWATALLHLSVFVPFLVFSKIPSLVMTAVYAAISIVVGTLITVLYNTLFYQKITTVLLLSACGAAFVVTVIVCMYLQNKSPVDSSVQLKA